MTLDYRREIEERCEQKQQMISVAMGKKPADLVFKNATYVNVFTSELTMCDIAVCDGIIVGLGEYTGDEEIDMIGKIICPGLMDAHIHLESSLVSPVEFAKAVIPHGTTTVITDPHEIANVMGVKGIEYMMQATKGLPLDVKFMLPSCVPATPLDEAGVILNYEDIDKYYNDSRVLGLAEMMDFEGVINGNEICLQKTVSCERYGKMIDGHGPDLGGNELNAYITAGISSDHECSNVDEAIEKIGKGQMIMIREGTAAKNLDSLMPLLTPKYADRCMFCSDDRHPSDLMNRGHIDQVIRRAVSQGVDPMIAIKVASYNGGVHFNLRDRGAIAIGYRADLIAVDNLKDFNVLDVYKDGFHVYGKDGLVDIDTPIIDDELDEFAHDTFHNEYFTEKDFSDDEMRGIIGMVSGEIITTDEDRINHADPDNDILKIAVIERHNGTGHIGIGYLKGYGLKRGAVATSFAHDSHNIIVTGSDDREMAAAVNDIIKSKGGIVVVENGNVKAKVKLEIAGLMTNMPLEKVNQNLEEAKIQAYKQGVSSGIDPFMTLSFLSLPVIPTLRLTTRGVFDVVDQCYV